MRITIAALALLGILGLATGCLQDQPLGSETKAPAAALAAPAGLAVNTELASEQILVATGWPREGVEETTAESRVPDQTIAAGPLGPMEFLGRFPLGGGVVHYSFRLRVGPGTYDVIGLHRVVREVQPNRPLRTVNNIFLLHGDYKNFAGCFLPGILSPRIPDDTGFAFYLAQNDVDVWGIDQAWALVPDDETDFSFMADWGMQKHVDWTAAGLGVARQVRRMTGNGDRPMLLSGYSGGAPIGFALLNQETQVAPGRRLVAGFIPVDQAMFTDVPAYDAAMCAWSANYQALIDAGQYQDNIPLRWFGLPARDDPNGPSELIPGFTNLQAALALASTPLIPDLLPHFLAGTFDESGMPTGFQYVGVEDWIDFLVSAPLYEAAAYERDEYLSACSQTAPLPWVSHFGEIRVPVLYVTAGGGFGNYYLRTLELLGGTDITHLNISTHPPEEALLDFGHIDLFLATEAPSRTWQPVLDWVRTHTPKGGGRDDFVQH